MRGGAVALLSAVQMKACADALWRRWNFSFGVTGVTALGLSMRDVRYASTGGRYW